jgi:hypothetical protein
MIIIFINPPPLNFCLAKLWPVMTMIIIFIFQAIRSFGGFHESPTIMRFNHCEGRQIRYKARCQAIVSLQAVWLLSFCSLCNSPNQ